LRSSSRCRRPASHLLSVGTLIPTKGHDLALRSAALAARSRPLVVVAPRRDQAEEDRLGAIAKAVGVELDLRVGVSDAELGELYATAHATLYLARLEPLGLVALEAQACGCPVVVADEGGLPETIVDGVTGWKVPRDAAMVARIVDLLDDADTREAASGAAVVNASRWNWTESASTIERLLAEVCRPGPAAAATHA
jgi:glycosyltransferase involved in cell wall biosynthesis